MLQRHAAFELVLRFRIAGGLELHAAELFCSHPAAGSPSDRGFYFVCLMCCLTLPATSGLDMVCDRISLYRSTVKPSCLTARANSSDAATSSFSFSLTVCAASTLGR